MRPGSLWRITGDTSPNEENMSTCFRPVNEVWGPSCDQPTNREDLFAIIRNIAENVDSIIDESEYSDLTVIWIEKGQDFLDYLLDNDFSNKAFVIPSMQNLVPEWQKSISSVDGSLRFYID
jgi:cation diffusion facilitator CzcD-associated flavoprotein CzcO